MARNKGGLVYSTGKETMASLLEGLSLGVRRRRSRRKIRSSGCGSSGKDARGRQ